MSDTSNERGLAARLSFSKTLVRQAGEAARQKRQQLSQTDLGVEIKGTQDFVTIVDVETENLLRGKLLEAFPSDGFLGEEGGLRPSNGGLWVVDPIDGTANFMRNLADWAVSVAYVENGKVRLGLVYDGGQDKLYWAQEGQGAFCDGNLMECSKTSDPAQAMGILGISRKTPFQGYIDLLNALQDAGMEHRRMGSAALGIIRVAEGTADFYYEAFVNAWDSLGGLIIAREAGATCAQIDLENYLECGGKALCATPELYRIIAQIADDRSDNATAA